MPKPEQAVLFPLPKLKIFLQIPKNNKFTELQSENQKPLATLLTQIPTVCITQVVCKIQSTNTTC